MWKLAPSGTPVTVPPVRTPGRRVALVAHPGAELYGSDRMMLETVSGLVEAGWQVTVTVPSPGPAVTEAQARGARVVLCPTPVLRKSVMSPRGLLALVRGALAALPAAGRLLREVRPDVVYVSTVTIPLWLPLARLLGVRTVAHVHEAESSAPAPVRTALALPLAFAHTVLTNSEFSRTVLEQALPPVGRRSSVVLNGVAAPELVIKAREQLAGPLRLLYVGRLSERKGADLAVEALADLVERGVDARLELLGAVFAGYEWFERDLLALAARRGVADRVQLLGFRPGVWPDLARADVVLVPSRFDEPFGNTAVEAVLAARPVVVSDTSGLREAARGYASAQVVPPGDAAALAAAVQEVQQHWSQYREAAWRDAGIAKDRHAPAHYRAAVVQQVCALVGASATPAGRVRI